MHKESSLLRILIFENPFLKCENRLGDSAQCAGRAVCQIISRRDAECAESLQRLRRQWLVASGSHPPLIYRARVLVA